MLVSNLSDSIPTTQTLVYLDGAAHVTFLTAAHYLSHICCSLGWIPVFNLDSLLKLKNICQKNASLQSDFRALHPSITRSSISAASIDWTCLCSKQHSLDNLVYCTECSFSLEHLHSVVLTRICPLILFEYKSPDRDLPASCMQAWMSAGHLLFDVQ